MAQRRLDILQNMGTDWVRAGIDAAIARVLSLPNIASIREMLSREPIITNVPLVPDRSVEAPEEELQLELL
jgi:hypothetical protein